MSNTQFARPITLRMDAAERQTLIRTVMNEITAKSTWINQAETVTPDQEAYVRHLRNILDRLCD